MGWIKSTLTGLGLVAGGFFLGGLAGDRYDLRNPIEHVRNVAVQDPVDLSSEVKEGQKEVSVEADIRLPFSYDGVFQSPVEVSYRPEAEGLRLGYIKDGNKVKGPYLFSSNGVQSTAYEIKRDTQGRVIELKGDNLTKKLNKKNELSQLEEAVSWEKEFE